MQLTLAANPKSGSGATAPDTVADALRRTGATVEQIELGQLSEPLPAGTERLVVAGGDGSVGSAAAAAREAGLPLAVIPVGTANDFARALDLPTDLHDACTLAAEPDARVRRVDIATFDGVPYVNAAAAGLSAQANKLATPLKPKLGALAYAAGALRAGLTSPALPCRVLCDGTECWDGKIWQVVVAATGAFGGGSEIGNTEVDDGLLDVAVVPAGSRIGLVRRAWGMRLGTLTDQADVSHHRCREVIVELTDGSRFNVDGEQREGGRPATRFGLLPGGVRVIVK